MIENELKILRKAIHPNIIKLVEDFRTDEFVYMVLEFYKVKTNYIISKSKLKAFILTFNNRILPIFYLVYLINC